MKTAKDINIILDQVIDRRLAGTMEHHVAKDVTRAASEKIRLAAAELKNKGMTGHSEPIAFFGQPG